MIDEQCRELYTKAHNAYCQFQGTHYQSEVAGGRAGAAVAAKYMLGPVTPDEKRECSLANFEVDNLNMMLNLRRAQHLPKPDPRKETVLSFLRPFAIVDKEEIAIRLLAALDALAAKKEGK